MGGFDKCLLPVGGVPLFFRVVAALQWAGFRDIVVATTERHIGVVWAALTWGLEVVYTSGLGYERDFAALSNRFAPALFAACDLADLSPDHIKPLVKNDVMTTATSGGRPVGLTWVTGDLDVWREVEVGPVMNINTWRDWLVAEEKLPPAYPLAVDVNGLKPHERSLGLVEIRDVRPLAVDVWTCTVLDGHHRLEVLRQLGAPVPVLPLDYRVVDVNFSKMEIMWRAASGLLYPPKSTWHVYREMHVSQIPTAMPLGRDVRPLRCEAL